MNHVLEFKQLDQHLLPYVGGKGAALAKLFQMGYPVPSGFIICSTAFEKDLLKPEVTFVIKEHLKRLRKNNHDVSFAIRSSALSEDSELASFAGEFETVLGVKEDDAVFDAITKVYESRKSARVEAYTLAKGIVSDHSMAIVIQVMIDADISGVIFTADPITGNRTHMIGNFIVGMGEQLVAGEATPFQFKYLKEKKLYEGCQESIRVAKKIVKLAIKIEKVMGSPQDIEWCIGNNNIWILQSRPITTLTGYNASTGEWNDSTTGNYLWSNANLSEATPDVMTPLTWSLLKMMHIDTLPLKIPHNYPMIGNIAGRPYINLSLLVSMTHVFEPNVRKTLRKWSDVFGNIPEEIDVPLLPLRFLDIIAMIPDNLKWEIMVKKLYHQLPSFIESNQQWCDETRQYIAQALTQDSLITIWNNTIKPHYMKNCFLLRVVMKRFQEPVFRPRPKLEKHLGIEQASILLSNFSKNASLASLEPLIGLSKLASEKISYDDYINLYGHRGPHEFEISMPGPDENSTWIEEQIASFKRNPVDLTALLNQKRTEYNTSLEQLKQYYPRHYNKILSQIKTITDAAIMREKLRSELVRTYRVIRTFVLKVGEMTQINDGVYFLNIDEILNVLDGRSEVIALIKRRQKTYNTACSFPVYPAVIKGRFDPLQWAMCEQRRSDLFDSDKIFMKSMKQDIQGFAGANGVIEGIVRRLDHVEEAFLLKPGEILVTTVTNIGWTPLFLHAAAIVTDVGAPLSHAAIVARELGIPAVVGCGNATMMLKTGDRVIVDGSKGTVSIIN